MGIESDEVTSLLIEQIGNNTDRLNAALKIIKSQQSIYGMLMDKLVQQLKDRYRRDFSEDWELIPSHEGNSWSSKDKYIILQNEDLEFEFGIYNNQKSFTEWYFYCSFYEGKEHKNEKLEILREENSDWEVMRDNGGYWTYLESIYINWEENETPWIDIINGRLASYIYKETVSIKKFLENKEIITIK